jgi:hypothetical protein
MLKCGSVLTWTYLCKYSYSKLSMLLSLRTNFYAFTETSLEFMQNDITLRRGSSHHRSRCFSSTIAAISAAFIACGNVHQSYFCIASNGMELLRAKDASLRRQSTTKDLETADYSLQVGRRLVG